MKKCFFIFVVFSVIVCLTSCVSQNYSIDSETDEILEMGKVIGTVDSYFSDDDHIVFIYSNLNPQIQKCYDSEQTDCLLQSPISSVMFEPGRGYAEFNAVQDENGEVLKYDVRFFTGEAILNQKTDGYFAKRFIYSPDCGLLFLGKISRKEDQYSAEPVIAGYPDILNRLGDLITVYANVDRDGSQEEIKFFDGSMKFSSFYAEYSSLNPDTIAVFENIETTSYRQNGYSGVKESTDRFYVEYIDYQALKNSVTGGQQLRYVDVEKLLSGSGECYTKVLDIKE